MMVAERILYRASEVAELIGASRAEVYLLIRRGILPSVKAGAMVRVPAAAAEGDGRTTAHQTGEGVSKR